MESRGISINFVVVAMHVDEGVRKHPKESPTDSETLVQRLAKARFQDLMEAAAQQTAMDMRITIPPNTGSAMRQHMVKQLSFHH